MRRVLMLTWLLVAAAPAHAACTILIVGDSLSAAHGMDTRDGWVALLQQRLDRETPGCRAVNASISGDISANGLARLPRLLAQHRPAVVIIELGGNDGLRGLSLDQLQHNIGAMIEKASAAGARSLVVGVELPPNYGKRYTERFRRAFQQAAAARGAALVPSIMRDFGADPAYMQPDGIHPNATAQPRMLETVWPALRPLLPQGETARE
jgi:acyl-CoA thioesterase I